MILQRTAAGLEIAAPAKINLFLEVLGRRSDGYHEVRTLLCPVSLFDRLTFEVTQQSAIDFQVRLPEVDSQLEQSEADPAWDIPTGNDNLVVRTVRRVQQALGTKLGCRIELHKAIPAAAGLGGGSSDAAAAIAASLIAWRGWNRELALQIAAEIGSDVPFFLGADTGFGLALATGRGEQCQLLAAKPAMNLMVTHPPVGCSTREVYLNYADYGEKRDFRKIVAACETGKLKKIAEQLFNSLQLPAASLTDWIDRQLGLFAASAATGALMSGSGSSCFGLIDDPSCVDRIRHAASALGLPRVYSLQAWYGDSIEQQLSKLNDQS